jgi:hypothetical protein
MSKPTRPQPSPASTRNKADQPEACRARTPQAPPHYRPQAVPKCLQPKAATPHLGQVAAPPVYRPHPVPKVLQRKMSAALIAPPRARPSGASQGSGGTVQRMMAQPQVARVHVLFGIYNCVHDGTTPVNSIQTLTNLQELIRASQLIHYDQSLNFIPNYIEERARKMIAGKPWPDGSTYNRWNFDVIKNEATGEVLEISASADNAAPVTLYRR